MEDTLSENNLKIYNRIFEQPMPHALLWREVWSMLESIADDDSAEEMKKTVKIKRLGQTLVMHRPRGKELVDKDEITKLRHFLQQSRTPSQTPSEAGHHLLVVIDHRVARIYSTEWSGSVPQKITPYDPYGHGRELHYKQDDSNGQRKPELKSFYEAVAKTLKNAHKIILFGSGTGASSALEQLLINLKEHHPTTAANIIGSFNIDEHHITENQLLAKARELFAVK